jgi:hypothetical protein
MTTTAFPGPLSVEGLRPPQTGPTPFIGGPAAIGNENPDFGPSLFWAGIGLRDPQYMQRIGAGANVAGGYPNQDVGFYAGGPWLVIDAAPQAPVADNIVASALSVSGTPMTLAGASTGVTVLAAPLTILPTGNVVPAGCLVLDGNPAWIGAGQSGAFAFLDPAFSVGRAVVVATLHVTVHGFDIYGVPMSETINAASGKKAFKFIQSVIPSTAATGTVGTLSIFGFPLRVDRYAYTDIYWNNIRSTVTGFVAAVTTDPATAVTGDVRGTYATQTTAADGTVRLQVWIRGSVANLVQATSWAAYRKGLLGVTQF